MCRIRVGSRRFSSSSGAHMRAFERWATVAFLFGTITSPSPYAEAQQAIPGRSDAPQSRTIAPVFGEAERSAVISAAMRELERTYVDADTARLISAVLQQKWKAGAYNALNNPAQFGEAVTADLRSINNDLHLSLRFQPPAPAGGGRGGPSPDAARLNFGLGKAEILEGNIGYLEINAFAEGSGYREAVVAALQFLSRTNAMIIDVRRNGGGSSGMSHFVFSHFLPASADPTILVKTRNAPEPVLRRSLAEVPGPRRTDVPLFLLTSQGSASAAEEFSFVLKNKKRAQLVGSRTAGAGHMVASVPVGNNFALGVSITRVSDAVTGKEWEQTGVIPDVAVGPAVALDEAYGLALKSVIKSTADDPERVRTLTRVLNMVEARRKSASASRSNWPKYVGVYDGRDVALVDGKLMYTRRAGGMSEELVPLSDNRFAIGANEFEFTSENGVRRLTVHQANGTSIVLERSTPK